MAPPRLELRPLANQTFVQGYPGIPASDSRPDAHLTGTIAVHVPSSRGVEAAWLRVEMCKVETLPRGQSWRELIGEGPMDVWKAETAWQTLTSQSFPFRVSVPEKLPPSLRLNKTSGIKYQLIASLKVRLKKGFMRKDMYETVVQDTQDFVLEKHELHSTWPIYNVPEEYETQEGPFTAKLMRNKWAYSVGDQMDLRIIVASKAMKTTKLKSISVGIRQNVSFFPETGMQAQPIQQKSIMLDYKTKRINKKVQHGEYFMQDLNLIVPRKNAIMSIHTAKHMEISHSLRVDIKIGKAVMTFDRLNVLLSGFLSTASSSMIARIGDVPSLGITQDSNPHAAREQPSVFVADNDPYLSSTTTSPMAPGRASLGARPDSVFAGDLPPVETGDFAALGTATPTRPAETASPMPPSAAWQSPHLSMRPGDILGQHGSSYVANASPSAEPKQRPVSVMMTPPRPQAPSVRHSTHAFSTAEQEKVRLFERARAEAEQYQSDMGESVSFPREQAPEPAPPAPLRVDPGAAPTNPSETPSSSPFLTQSEARAVDEKARLQSHYAQLDAQPTESAQPPITSILSQPPPPALTADEPTPAPSYFAPPRAENESLATAPPRPPKVPLT